MKPFRILCGNDIYSENVLIQMNVQSLIDVYKHTTFVYR